MPNTVLPLRTKKCRVVRQPSFGSRRPFWDDRIHTIQKMLCSKWNPEAKPLAVGHHGSNEGLELSLVVVLGLAPLSVPVLVKPLACFATDPWEKEVIRRASS